MRKTIRRNLAYDDVKHLYYVTMHEGMNPDGTRRRRVRTYRRLEDAERSLEKFLDQRLARSAAPPCCLTLGEWLECWMRECIRPSRELTTVHGYDNIIRLHLIPALGTVELRELTPAQLQCYYAAMLRKGLSGSTVRKHHVLLHTALRAAVRQGRLCENAASRVVPPARKPPRHRYYAPEQLRDLFRCSTGTEIEPAIKLAGYLGLRRSEICGLKWRSVDLENCVLCVNEVRTAAGGVVIEKSPKSYASERRLGYRGVDDLEGLLRRLHSDWTQKRRKEGEHFNPEGYVLATRHGEPWQPDALGRRIAAFVAAQKLPPISLHGLRHSFASVANGCRVPMFTISRALGHSSTSVTSSVYTHLFDETVQDVVSVVADAITPRV